MNLFDDLQQATEEQLRQQYLDIQKFIDEHEAQMTEEEFNSPARDYMFDDEARRMQAIHHELVRRDLPSMGEWLKGQAIDQNPLSWYAPWDGDFDLGDGEELARLAADLLGNHWISAVEVALSLHGPATKTDPPEIRVEVKQNWDEEGWGYDKFLSLPEGWTYAQVSNILWDGYTVFFEPINKPDDPDDEEEDSVDNPAANEFNKMLDALHCECGGKYEPVDEVEGSEAGTMEDSYQCNECETWCTVIWNKETQEEIRREYGL